MDNDQDIPIGRILGFALGLATLLISVALACWFLYNGYWRKLALQDPPPSPIPEANEPVLPPEPRLQKSPVADMEALRAGETAILNSYGWIDQDAAIARIPIERAIDLTLYPGLRPARTEGGGAGGGDPDGGAP